MYLSESVSNHPIGILHLNKRTQNALLKAEILTIKQLLDAREIKFSQVSQLGPSAIKNIEEIVSSLNICIDDKGDIDWFKFWESRKIKIIPENFSADIHAQDIVGDLPQIIESMLKMESDEREWVIIERRFGLGGASLLTLEELGLAFGLTRERIRQIEANALDNLKNVLIDNSYENKNYHVHPEIISTLQNLSCFINQITNNIILENKLMSDISEQYSIDSKSVEPSLHLIFMLNGLSQIRFNKSDLRTAWGNIQATKIRKLEKIISRIDKLLTEEVVTPVGEIDILIEINKILKGKNRISLDELRQYLNLCSSIEKHSDGFYWGKFEQLTGRGNQTERILFENGEPLHINQITRKINHRLTLHSKRLVNDRNLGNQISGDARFTPIGRSGEWGLSSWTLNTGTIIDLMKQCLMTRNTAATSDEIYLYVSERRPVQRASIDVYLMLREEFSKVDRIKWGLTNWDEVKDGTNWTPKEVGQFVEQLFKKHRTKKLQYQLVKESLIEATGLTKRQVQGLLSVNPVITTEREKNTNELFAYFNPDYKENLNQIGAIFNRKNKTLRQQVDDFVKMTLTNAPGQQITLAELVNLLINKFNRRDKTFYHYISDLEYIEKFTIPETNVKMCRFKREQKAFPFSQVEDIQTKEIRTKVGRALTFLNESDVDISLFLLSKEFEASLNNYLVTANAKGQLQDLPNGRLSLVSMVDYVGRKNIISDKAVLHFLRQNRNDRAHGSMPTIEERKVMMKYAQTTAGMYIDYIKFFDDLTNKL